MALVRMMPNMGGPRYTSRLLIACVATSIMLYAGSLEVGVADVINKCRNKLSAVYRGTALRVCSLFRTVSYDAAFVISGMMPVDILTDEMANIYNAKTKNAERERSINRLIIISPNLLRGTEDIATRLAKLPRSHRGYRVCILPLSELCGRKEESKETLGEVLVLENLVPTLVALFYTKP